MPYHSPKTWTSGTVATATDLNLYVRDNSFAIGRMEPYDPVWRASTTNPDISNGRIYGRYAALDDICFVSVQLITGSTTTFGSGFYYISLPIRAGTTIPGVDQMLPAQILNSGVARYYAIAVIENGSSEVVMTEGCQWSSPNANIWQPTLPFTFGSGDSFSFSGWYRI